MTDVLLCLRNQTLFARIAWSSWPTPRRYGRRRTSRPSWNTRGPRRPTRRCSSSAAVSHPRSTRRSSPQLPKDAQKVFWELFENQKHGWITGFFRQKKIAISSRGRGIHPGHGGKQHPRHALGVRAACPLPRRGDDHQSGGCRAVHLPFKRGERVHALRPVVHA